MKEHKAKQMLRDKVGVFLGSYKELFGQTFWGRLVFKFKTKKTEVSRSHQKKRQNPLKLEEDFLFKWLSPSYRKGNGGRL